MKKITLTKKMVFIYKFAIISTMVLFFLIFLVPIFIKNENIAVAVMYALFFASMFCGLVVLVFPFVVEDKNNIMSVKTIANKYFVKVSSFETFIQETEATVLKWGFSRIAFRSFENYEMYLYANPAKLKHLSFLFNVDVVLVIRTSEINQKIALSSSDEYVKCMETYYNKNINHMANNISLMTIICVDRINSDFRKILNSGVEQDFGITRLISGISFGGKKLYIATQDGGLAILRYKSLRKKFFKLFDFLLPKHIENDNRKAIFK